VGEGEKIWTGGSFFWLSCERDSRQKEDRRAGKSFARRNGVGALVPRARSHNNESGT